MRLSPDIRLRCGVRCLFLSSPFSCNGSCFLSQAVLPRDSYFVTKVAISSFPFLPPATRPPRLAWPPTDTDSAERRHGDARRSVTFVEKFPVLSGDAAVWWKLFWCLLLLTYGSSSSLLILCMCVRERAFGVYPLPLLSLCSLSLLPSPGSLIKDLTVPIKSPPSLFTLLRQRKETDDGQTKHHLRRNITHTVLSNTSILVCT